MSSPGPAITPTEPQPQTGRAVRLFGVPVRLHFTFILFVLFLIISARGMQSAVFNGVYVLALFTSVLLHELGHASIASRYGIKTIEIVLYPIGGVARLERMPRPHEELWIALAGPLVNVLIACALGAWLAWTKAPLSLDSLLNPSDANLINRVALGNIILAVFNMIPAFPMDGGRVLRAVLAKFRPEEQATRIAAGAGKMFAILMGLYGLLNGQFMLLFIALFVYLAASQETAVVVGRALTHGIPVRSAMITDFRTLSHGNTIREAANMLLATSQTDFPIVMGEQVIGMLGRNALLRGMAVDGPDAYVAGIMDRNPPKLDPEMDLNEALPLMSDTACALVMQGESLLGLLTRENLTEFMMLRRVGLDTNRA